MAERGTVEPQLDGDLRRIRSGGDLGFLYHSCHDPNRSNAKMMKQKKIAEKIQLDGYGHRLRQPREPRDQGLQGSAKYQATETRQGTSETICRHIFDSSRTDSI